jgi:threonine aldolase
VDDLIDLRSDTVTRPSIGMREAMLTAEVGDDVYGEDPTITALEQRTAELFGMAAGLFVTSGTQGNLLALLCHCHRGDEYIAGARAHSYLSEGGGGAVLASIQPQPVENNSDGTIELQKIKDAIKPDDFHYARTRLLCLENTFYGQPLPLSYLEDAAKLGHEYGLALPLFPVALPKYRDWINGVISPAPDLVPHLGLLFPPFTPSLHLSNTSGSLL